MERRAERQRTRDKISKKIHQRCVNAQLSLQTQQEQQTQQELNMTADSLGIHTEQAITTNGTEPPNSTERPITIERPNSTEQTNSTEQLNSTQQLNSTEQSENQIDRPNGTVEQHSSFPETISEYGGNEAETEAELEAEDQADAELEERLIDRLVEVVSQRDSIHGLLEADRLREKQEDTSIAEHVGKYQGWFLFIFTNVKRTHDQYC